MKGHELAAPLAVCMLCASPAELLAVLQSKLVGQTSMEQWMMDSSVAGLHALAALSDEVGKAVFQSLLLAAAAYCIA